MNHFRSCLYTSGQNKTSPQVLPTFQSLTTNEQCKHRQNDSKYSQTNAKNEKNEKRTDIVKERQAYSELGDEGGRIPQEYWTNSPVNTATWSIFERDCVGIIRNEQISRDVHQRLSEQSFLRLLEVLLKMSRTENQLLRTTKNEGLTDDEWKNHVLLEELFGNMLTAKSACLPRLGSLRGSWSIGSNQCLNK